jgi:hypothetical protein
MLRLATDADVHGDVIRGMRRRQPAIDVVRVQDALPEGAADAEVLAWAAKGHRVLITNDRNTMIATAQERAKSGEVVRGIIVTTNEQSIGSTIDDLFAFGRVPFGTGDCRPLCHLPSTSVAPAHRTGWNGSLRRRI